MSLHLRLTTACAAAALLLVPAAGAHADPGAHDRAASTGTVAQIRKAVAPYQDVAAALAAGYVPTGHCEESAEGAMGVHYLNFDLLQNDPVNPAAPPILLYAPDRAGGLQLVGVEFLVPDLGQERPHLAGEPFEGPMPGHTPDMPVHYDLHVWTHVANPRGVFATWNPRVSCSGAAMP